MSLEYISDHSARAIGRLISWLGDKPKYKSLLRCLSAGRVDLIKLLTGQEYAFLVNSYRFSTDAVVGDTLSGIADRLVVLVNDEFGTTFKAHKRNPDDDYFYITPKDTPGIELDIESEDTSLVRIHRIGLIDQLQELEDVFFDIYTKTALDNSEGEQLDKIGTIVGLDRAGGQSDENYRILLGLQIRKNLSQGEPETLIQVTKAVVGSAYVEYEEVYPARVHLVFDDEVPNPQEFVKGLEKIAAGGVKVGLTQTTDDPFMFDGETAEELGLDEGEFSQWIEED